MKKFWITAGLSIFLAGMGWGQMTYTWVGSDVDNNWNEAGNWDPDSGYPGETAAGDNVTINTTATININGAIQNLGSLTIATGANPTLNNAANPLTVAGLTLNGNLTLSGTALFTVTGTSTISANVTTTGAQTYGAVTLGGTGTRTLTGSTVTMGAITGGNHNLTITGNAVFNDAVNGVAVLQVSGTSAVNGDITTTGNQTYTGAVILGKNVNFTAPAASTVRFNANVYSNSTGPYSLTVATAILRFNVAVGAPPAGNTSLASVTATGTGTHRLVIGVTTTGDQTYSGIVELGNTANPSVTLAAGTTGTITFSAAVRGRNSTQRGLTVSSGNVVFGGAVSYISALTINGSGNTTFNTSAAVTNTTSVAINSSGTIYFNNATVTTTGTGNAQVYGGPVVLGANVTFTGAANSTIRFSGTVNSDNPGTLRALTAATANVQFNGVVGGSNAIGALTVTGNGTTTVGAAVTAASVSLAGASAVNANITTTGNQTYSGNVTLGGTGTRILTSTGGSINAAGIVSGTNGITVHTLQGITLNNAGNTLSGEISLNNDQTGTPANAISFTTSGAAITVSGTNQAANQNFTINGTNNITIGTGGITGTGTITLISSAGAVEQNSTGGVISGAALTVGAGAGISLTGENSVSVLGITGAGGAVDFRNTVSLTTNAIDANGREVTITNGDTITVSDAINAATVKLETNNDSSAAANNITISAILNIPVGFTIISGPLPDVLPDDLGDLCGTVTINNTVTVTGATGTTITIEAGDITVNGSLTATNGNIDLAVDNFEVSLSNIIAGGNIIIRPRHGNIDLVYYGGSYLPPDSHYDSGSPFKRAVSSTPNDEVFRGFRNVYLVNVNDTENRTITINANGFIEFYGSYIYSGTHTSHLSLTAEDGIQSYHPDPTPGVVNIQLNNSPFNIGTQTLTIDRGSLSITANVITLDNVVSGTDGPYNLTLESVDSSSSAQAITVSGALGADGSPLGDIQVTNASTAVFSDVIYAGNFSFAGTALTVNGAMTVGGTTAIANSGVFTQNTGANINSAGSFTQSGSGRSVLSASITTATDNISFAGPITVAGTTTLDSSAGGGDINLTFTAPPPAIAGAGNLTMAAGTGNISIAGQIGATAASFGNITVDNANDVTFQNLVTANSFTQTAGTGSTSFNGAQNYTGNFGFTGAALTVGDTMTVGGTTGIANSGPFTLNADLTSTGTVTVTASGSGSADLAADITAGTTADISFTGPIVLAKPDQATVTLSAKRAISLASVLTGPAAGTNNLDLSAPSVTIAAGSNINPDESIGTITINGSTTNNGIINAGPVTAGNTAVTFNGNYNGSAGRLIGTVGTNPFIDFYGDANLNGFTHNDDIIRFVSTPGTNHAFDVDPASTLGEVVILAGNTVTANSAVNQTQSKTLTLEQNSSLIILAPAASWIQGTLESPPHFTSGFYGNNGTLVFDENSRLETEDFFISANSTVTLTEKSTIVVRGHADINSTFTDGSGGQTTIDYSTIIMNGAGKYLRSAPSVRIGNLVVNGGTATGGANAAAGTILETDLILAGSITINDGRVLDSASKKITVIPRPSVPAGEPANFWEQIGTGQFLYRESEVEFGDSTDPAGGHTYALRGDTTWYTLTCQENKAILQFSNYSRPGTVGHRVFGKLKVIPVDTSDESMAIRLTRETSFGAGVFPSVPEWVAPDTVNEHFWFFVMDPAGEMDINFVIIEYSFSSRKIPVPTESSSSGSGWFISAWPYVAISNPTSSEWDRYLAEGGPRTDIDGHNVAFLYYPDNRFNVDWFVFNNFFYSYAEDSTHSGRIDRIRLQSAFDLNGDFSDFKVNVWDAAMQKSYTVTGYKLVQKREEANLGSFDLNSIYVLLDENEIPYDTAMNFYWEIAENTTLKDLVTGTTIIGNPPPAKATDLKQDSGTTVDTAPPRVTYALAVPGHNEIFFQVSEPVDNPGGLRVNIPALGQSIVPDVLGSSNNKEFLVRLDGSASFTPDQLFSGVTFTVEGLRDTAEPAEDLSAPSPDRPYSFMYPPPKYPQNYNYDNVNGSSQAYTFQPYVSIKGVPQPPLTGVVFPKNGSYDPATGMEAPVEHRASDMLISVPPSDLAETSQHDQFFIWPLWAKYRDDPALYGELGEFLPSGYGYMGRDTAFSDSDIIWDFTGKRFLEQHDLTLQSKISARISDAISPGAANKLIYAFNVPDQSKSPDAHNPPGLWHPGLPLDIPNPPFVNLFPLLFPASSAAVMSNAGSGLYNHDLRKSEYPGNATAEFFYHLDGTQDGTLAARLDMAPGSSIPSDWYRRIKPFSFGLHDVTRQRGGVTILNNVINSEKRERVFLEYKLNNTGRVTIQVFTLDGNLVKVLTRENQNASDTYYRVSWDGTNNGGRPVARGMYFIRIVAPDIDEIRKVMVVK